jgi:hypothetical protein
MSLRAMLYCLDIATMSAFYSGILDLTATIRSPEYVDFGVLALHAIPAEIVAAISMKPSPQPRESVPVKLIFEVPDPAVIRANLEARGHLILDRPWGAWDAVDPEGNVFQVTAI